MTRIAPQSGFTWHPHRGLEIYSWMLEGTLYHEDSTGGQGNITRGELQRMFSGAWIEHQELNRTDEPVRLIQIWFIADPQYRNLEPHYQQVGSADLPVRKVEDAKVYSLIGDGSPMQHHIKGRLTASAIPAGGATHIEPPKQGEDLFLYITDGAGHTNIDGQTVQLDQYDVILARPDMPSALFEADSELSYLCFYLPSFMA
jgi:quercetin 2,3-dioxygenase